MKKRNVIIGIASVIAIGVSVDRIYNEYSNLELRANTPFYSESVDPVADSSSRASDFAPIRVVPPFPAITNATFIKGQSVTDEVTKSELVLGCVINDEARAYPINMLTNPQREIVNDRLGGVPIAATW